jgi:hypothetical protein
LPVSGIAKAKNVIEDERQKCQPQAKARPFAEVFRNRLRNQDNAIRLTPGMQQHEPQSGLSAISGR